MTIPRLQKAFMLLAVLGSFWLLCTIFYVGAQMVYFWNRSASPGVLMLDNTEVRLFLVFPSLFFVVISAAGLGFFEFRSWSRKRS